MMIESAVYKALKSTGIPIDGVSFGKIDDKATWRIDFTAGATDAQKAAAQAVIDAFDPVAEAAKPKPRSTEERLTALETDVSDLKRVRP